MKNCSVKNLLKAYSFCQKISKVRAWQGANGVPISFAPMKPQNYIVDACGEGEHGSGYESMNKANK